MRILLFIMLACCGTVFTLKAQCPPAKTSGIHIVQKGETLYGISKKYKVTVDQIRQWSSLSSDMLAVCQELRVAPVGTENSVNPTAPPATTTVVYPKQSGPTHIVQRGETVASIARLYGFTEARFRQFNNLKTGEEVTQGAVLKSDDCQCPPLNPVTSDPLVAYETYEQLIDPATVAETATTSTQAGKSSLAENMFETTEATPAGIPAGIVSAPVAAVDFKPANAPYMSAPERAMVDEINLVRTNPTGYIPVIEDYKRAIQAGTASGTAEACDELIGELKSMKPLNLLEPSECLYLTAKKHGEEQQVSGALTHKGADNSWPWERVQHACPGMNDGNENFIYGTANVRSAVAKLLVDAELPDRGHRKTMLNKDWKYIASFYIGNAGIYENTWIQQFAR